MRTFGEQYMMVEAGKITCWVCGQGMRYGGNGLPTVIPFDDVPELIAAIQTMVKHLKQAHLAHLPQINNWFGYSNDNMRNDNLSLQELFLSIKALLSAEDWEIISRAVHEMNPAISQSSSDTIPDREI